MKHIFQIVVAVSLLSMILQVKAGPLFPQQRKDLLLKSDSLFGKGVELYRQGSYIDAVPFFVLSDSIDKAELDSTDNRRDYSAMWLASCYYKLGDTLKAQSVHDYYRFVPVDRRLTVRSDSLSSLGMSYFAQGDYSKALGCFLACAEIEKSIVGELHIWFGNTVNLIADCYFNLNDTVNAIIYKKLYADIVRNNFGEYSLLYIGCLSDNATLYSLYSQHELALEYYKKAYHLADFVELSEEDVNFLIQRIAEEYNSIGLEYYYNSNYSEAIRIGKEAIDFYKVLDKNNLVYAKSLNNLASFYSEVGNYSEAIRLGTEAMNLYKRVSGDKHPDYATSLSNLAGYYSSIGNYNEAIRLNTEAYSIRKEVLGDKHPDYANSLNNLANDYSLIGNYSEAIRFGTEAMKVYKVTLGDKHPEYAISLNNLASYYYAVANYNEAIRLCTEALNIRKEILGDKHPDYANSLNNLATNYLAFGKYTEAIRLCTEAMDVRRNLFGEKHPSYAMSLNNLAYYYSLMGNYSEAIHFGTEAMNVYKEVLGDKHPVYAASLNNLAGYYSYKGDYLEAIKLCTEAISIRKEVLGDKHPDYANSLNNLASNYSAVGKYDEAIKICMEEMAIYKIIYGETHPYYAKTLSNLAVYYSYIANYTEAIRLHTEALNITEKVLGKKHPDYARTLSNLSVLYFDLGDYTKAINLETEALNIRNEIYGDVHQEIAASLNNIAQYYSSIGNFQEAIRLCNEALKIRKEALGEKHPDYAVSLNNLAGLYFKIGDKNEAIILCNEALKIRKEVLGDKHPDYALSLNNLANFYSFVGDNDEAAKLCTEALSIQKETFGENHPAYALYLDNLAKFYLNSRQFEKSATLHQKLTELYINLILTTFGDLTASSQTLFWDKYNNYFNNELPFLAYKIPTDSMRISAYNGILFSKGLLLNAELEMKKLLQESGDSAIISLYDDVQMNKILFGKMLEKPIKERFFDVDSLQQVIQEQEQELIQQSKTYGDYTRNLRIDWKDVQVKLGHEDIALEFLSFPNENGNVMYAVLVLKPGMDCPDIVPLFEEKQLMQIPVYEYYNTTELYRLVWQPLEEKLKGVRNVYFAPAGELYNIAIETLPDSDSTWIFNHFDLHRLSSTRQLAYIQDKYSNNRARIYGGLKYDTDLAQLINDNNKYMTEDNRYTRSFDGNFIADSLHMRNGAAELPGTRIEAENIKRTLDMAHVENDLLTDSIGTESSFKAMSGKRIRALHIATHGFYWTEKEASQKKNMEFLLLDDNQSPKYKEDKSLTRSGLLMAGANNALMGVDIPDNVDNGILTAKEIAGLDLRGMDMVVLSACQTGLGEITNEGVFGLQRGFKKAGAKSLLMSLWKVDDRATQLLMTRFYTNLLAGMGKHKALIEAQRFVREYEEERVVIVNEMTPSQKRRMEKQGIIWKEQTEIRKECPYSHPKYWAAFIMLDGIDAD